MLELNSGLAIFDRFMDIYGIFQKHRVEDRNGRIGQE
jgi:hypothetical protein